MKQYALGAKPGALYLHSPFVRRETVVLPTNGISMKSELKSMARYFGSGELLTAVDSQGEDIFFKKRGMLKLPYVYSQSVIKRAQ